jgi:hypothetical protein
MSAANHSSRLMIVSNRLPVGIKCLTNDKYDFSPSCGGLVTGLKGLSHNDVTFLWYGWPGTTIHSQRVSHLKETLMEKFSAVPVLLDQETAELYYNGFSSTSRDQCIFVSNRRTDDCLLQTPPSGHSSTTSLIKSLSMSRLLRHTRLPTRLSRTQLRVI